MNSQENLKKMAYLMFISIHGTNLYKLPTSFAVFQLISSRPWIHN